MAIKRKIRLLAWNFLSSYQHINIGFDASLYESPNPTSAIFTDKLFNGSESEDVISIYDDRFPDTQARLDYTVGEYTVTTAAEFSDLDKVPCENLCNSSRLSESAEYIHFTGSHNLTGYYYNNGFPASVGLAVFEQEKYESLYPNILDCADVGGKLYTVCGIGNGLLTYAIGGVLVEYHQDTDNKSNIIILDTSINSSVLTITIQYENVTQSITKSLDGNIAYRHVTHCQFSPDNSTLSVLIDAVVRKDKIIHGETLPSKEYHNIFDCVIHLETVDGLLKVATAENVFELVSNGFYDSNVINSSVDINVYENEFLHWHSEKKSTWNYSNTLGAHAYEARTVEGTVLLTEKITGNGIKVAYKFNENSDDINYSAREFVELKSLDDAVLTSNETFSYTIKNPTSSSLLTADAEELLILLSEFDWEKTKNYITGKINFGLVSNDILINKISESVNYLASNSHTQARHYNSKIESISATHSTASYFLELEEMSATLTAESKNYFTSESGTNYRDSLAVNVNGYDTYDVLTPAEMTLTQAEIDAGQTFKKGSIKKRYAYAKVNAISKGQESNVLEIDELFNTADIELNSSTENIEPIFKTESQWEELIGESDKTYVTDKDIFLYYLDGIGGISRIDDELYVACVSVSNLDLSKVPAFIGNGGGKNNLWLGDISNADKVLSLATVASINDTIDINADSEKIIYFGMAQ